VKKGPSPYQGRWVTRGKIQGKGHGGGEKNKEDGGNVVGGRSFAREKTALSLSKGTQREKRQSKVM